MHNATFCVNTDEALTMCVCKTRSAALTHNQQVVAQMIASSSFGLSAATKINTVKTVCSWLTYTEVQFYAKVKCKG